MVESVKNIWGLTNSVKDALRLNDISKEMIDDLIGEFCNSVVNLLRENDDFNEVKECISIAADLNTRARTMMVNEIEKGLDNFSASLEKVLLICGEETCFCPVCKKKIISGTDGVCPICKSTKVDSQIISFLQSIHADKAAEFTKILCIGASTQIKEWLDVKCIHMDISHAHDVSEVNQGDFSLVIYNNRIDFEEEEESIALLISCLNNSGYIYFPKEIAFNCEKCFEREDYLSSNYVDIENDCYIVSRQNVLSLDMEEKISYDEELCNKGPLVSVVMSSYNHEKYVEEAILSVLNQTYKNIEFLVADDASSDGTVAILKKYEKYFSKVLYFETNRGCREAELRDIATGKYIALINSDDVWEPDKLYLQVKYMENNPNIGVCFTWCRYTDENLNRLDNNVFRVRNRTSQEWIRHFWKNGNCLCNPSSLARRTYRVRFQKNGRECRQLPDFFNWIELLQLTSIYVIPKELTSMRRHKSTASTNVSASTRVNSVRDHFEARVHWFWTIRNMEPTFFAEAFREFFVDKEACKTEELLCEKFFLLLNSGDPSFEHEAFMYLAEVYEKIYVCLEEKYNYKRKSLADDYVEKGFARLYLK